MKDKPKQVRPVKSKDVEPRMNNDTSGMMNLKQAMMGRKRGKR